MSTISNSLSTVVVRNEPNTTTTTSLCSMDSFTDVSVGGWDLFQGLLGVFNRAVHVAVDTCKSILPDPEPKPKAPPKTPTKIYGDRKSFSVEEATELLKAYIYPLWEDVKSIKAECKQLRDNLESLKQQTKRCNTCKGKLDETEPRIVELEVEATDSACPTDQPSDSTIDGAGGIEIDWLATINASPNLMDQPRIDKFEDLYSAIQEFVLTNIPETTLDSELGFGAEKISTDYDAWGLCTKDFWMQGVIANIIHRELFEYEGIGSKDVTVTRPLSATLSEELYCTGEPVSSDITQDLNHLSEKAYACAHILQTSHTRYTWAQKIGKTKVKGKSATVCVDLAGGTLEGEKLYEVAFTVFGALVKYYGENGEEQVEINKARVVARCSLED
ncbi:hypothetical protein BDD12DRAFT_801713 [Trichophaea hybrida]|nr:hypothetical protein BDD12DRAFT_801713 [Trichophaea hybrida]